jgi:porin
LAAAGLPVFGQEETAGMEPNESPPQPSSGEVPPFWEWDRLTGDWGGLRTELSDKGVTVGSWWIIDWSQNWHGGLNTEGSAFRHLFGVDLTFDTEAMFGWKGGTLFGQFYNQNGEDGTATDVGDFQAFSNIDADGRSQVAELWYEQWLIEDRLRIKIGKVDANTEFDYVDFGTEFIHSTPGFSPTIHALPTYPDPAMSVNVFAYPTDWAYVGFGLYDGAATNDFRTGSRGPSTFGHEDWFYIGEGGVTWLLGENHLEGRFGAGGWYHSGTFDRFDGQRQNGAGGFYFVFDQRLYRENPLDEEDEQGIGMFVATGHADRDVSDADHSVSTGMAWTGMIPGRDDDVFGVGLNYVHFTEMDDAPYTKNHELAYELFYKIQISPALSIKPNLQYIRHPGGEGLSDAFVGTLRLEFAF